MKIAINIFQAIEFNDKEFFNEWLKRTDDLEVSNASHWSETPLAYAAYCGRAWMVDVLIGKGANIEALDQDGETPLFYGVRSKANTLEVINLLMNAGANTQHVRNHGSQRSLHEFAHNFNYKGGIKDAVLARLGLAGEFVAPLPAAAHQQEDEVSYVSPMRITFNRTAGRAVLEEVYLFDIMERVTYVLNEEDDRVQAVCREQFDMLGDSSALRDAYNEHVKWGGMATENEVFGNVFNKTEFSFPRK